MLPTSIRSSILFMALLVMLALGMGGCSAGSDQQGALNDYLDDLRPALETELSGLKTIAEALNGDSPTPDQLSEAYLTASDKAAEAAKLAAGVEPSPELKEANDLRAQAWTAEAEYLAKVGDAFAELGAATDQDALAESLDDLQELFSEEGQAEMSRTMDASQEALLGYVEEAGLGAPAWYNDLLDEFKATAERMAEGLQKL